MGLDSVELVMQVENEFDIQIPDSECENIYTVQDFVNSVYDKIKIYPTDKCLLQIIFYRIRKSLTELNIEHGIIQRNSKISELLTETELKENWNKIENKIKLKLPELVPLDFNRELDTYVKFFGFKIFKRTHPVTDGTIEQLIDWIISLNFKEVIDIEKITTKYEVERIIAGIISDKIGIPISEIKLKHSITIDLGID